MSLASRVRAYLPVIVAAGVLAVAGVVAIPLGGWDTVQLQSAILPEQPVGEPYVGARLSTSIDDVYVTDEHPDGFTELEPGEIALVVVATMEDTGVEPELPLGSTSFYTFTVPGVVELGAPIEAHYSTILARDGTFIVQLSPGVPDTVLFVFVVDDVLFAAGDELRIGLTDATAQEAEAYEGTRWVEPHIAVEVPIVIRDER